MEKESNCYGTCGLNDRINMPNLHMGRRNSPGGNLYGSGSGRGGEHRAAAR